MGEVDTQVVGLFGCLGPPNGIEKVGVGEHPAGVAGELREQGKLDGGERHGLVRNPGLVRGQVNGKQAE